MVNSAAAVLLQHGVPCTCDASLKPVATIKQQLNLIVYMLIYRNDVFHTGAGCLAASVPGLGCDRCWLCVQSESWGHLLLHLVVLQTLCCCACQMELTESCKDSEACGEHVHAGTHIHHYTIAMAINNTSINTCMTTYVQTDGSQDQDRSALVE